MSALRGFRRAALRAAVLLDALLPLVTAGSLTSCATSNILIGRGGPVFELRVVSINGNATTLRGPSAHPACVLQVANRVVPVWLALPEHADQKSPVVLEADAIALKEGILVERSWNEAVVHEATDGELAAGAAVVYVPGRAGPTTVELRFDRVSRLSQSDRKDNLAEHRAGLEQPVRGGDLH